MRIYKFGGASIKDAESVKNVTSILQQEGTENCLLVISAMGKMTNAFEKIVHAYCYEREGLKAAQDFVANFHTEIIKDLFGEASEVQEKIDILFGKLSGFLAQNTSKDYDYLYDQIVCFGELASTTIVSNYFAKEGVENVWNDVRQLIITDSSYRDAKVDWQKTQETILQNIDQQKLNIVQGFLGGDTKGNTTTLGREGSDYTAGIFAYCLDANAVTIWKDVQGVLNADPRVFKDTQLLEQISYEETIEMAFYGASVIHPKTIQPLQSKDIPLYVRSFKDLKLSGTKVTRGVAIQPLLPCFIVKKDQILVSISALDFSFMVEDNISHIFKLLHQYLLKVNLIQNSAISFSVCVDNKFNQFETFYEELKSSYKVDVVKGVDLYTVRHFTEEALERINKTGQPLLTQINKETAQVVVNK
ncbi:aspartate kinase [Pseudotenacibaculum haliotis]|uniref:Aspartokinase n=1 Tax=Pseudotenacibaculum haliotis TaxID=1862138 RepID=A0ABW5LRF6_9FLAO